MTYNYKIQNLDCANCASKLERILNKLDGIKSCSINFFAQKACIETEAAMSDELFDNIAKAAKKAERGIKLIAQGN